MSTNGGVYLSTKSIEQNKTPMNKKHLFNYFNHIMFSSFFQHFFNICFTFFLLFIYIFLIPHFYYIFFRNRNSFSFFFDEDPVSTFESIDSIDKLEGYNRVNSPSPNERSKDIHFDENGFINAVRIFLIIFH